MRFHGKVIKKLRAPANDTTRKLSNAMRRKSHRQAAPPSPAEQVLLEQTAQRMRRVHKVSVSTAQRLLEFS